MREVFRSLFNDAEDVAIEHQLAEEFAVEADFAVTNDAFRRFRDDAHCRYARLVTDENSPPLTYTVFEALLVVLLDAGFGRVDRSRALLDPADERRQIHGDRRDVVVDLLPELHRLLDDLRATPCGTRRVDRVFESFQVIRSELEALALIQTQRVQTCDDWLESPRSPRPNEEHTDPQVASVDSA